MEQNPSYISTVIPTLAFTVSWFVIGLTVFGPLHWMFEARKQPFWRSDIKVDIVYWIFGPS